MAFSTSGLVHSLFMSWCIMELNIEGGLVHSLFSLGRTMIAINGLVNSLFMSWCILNAIRKIVLLIHCSVCGVSA